MAEIFSRWPENSEQFMKSHQRIFNSKKPKRPGKTIYVLRDGKKVAKGEARP